MNRILARIIGTLLLIAAIGGLLFSLVGLIGIWSFKSRAETAVSNSLELIDASMASAADGLVITKQSLDSTVGSVMALQSTLQATANTVDTAGPLFDSMGTVMGEQLPASITAAQTSLLSAQASAKTIDSVLTALNSIPFIGSGLYEPEVPMYVGLGDLATSLDGLPESFQEMQTNLSATSESMVGVEEGLTVMASEVSEIASSLTEYDRVIDQYLKTFAALQDGLQNVQDKLATIINSIALALTFFLAWMAIAQLGLLTQGIELVRGLNDARPEPPVEAA
jgi:nitrogen fixation/metabolism regulation signal transduction histidine kinase